MVANHLGTSQRGREEKVGGSPTAATAERRSSNRIRNRESRRRSVLGAVSEGEDEGEQPISDDEDEPSDATGETTEDQQIEKKDVKAEEEEKIKEERFDKSSIILSPGAKDEMRKKWGEHTKAQEQFLANQKGPVASSSSSSGMPTNQATTAQNTTEIALTHQPSPTHNNNDTMMVLLREVREQQEQMLLMFSSQQQEIQQMRNQLLESENQMAIINSSQGAISEVIDGLHRKVPSARQKQTKRDRGKIGVKKEVEESDDSSSSSSDSESSDDETAKPASSPSNKEGLKTMKKQLKKEEIKLKLQKLAAPDVDRIDKLVQGYKRHYGAVATNKDFEGPLKPHLEMLTKTEGWDPEWLSTTGPAWKPHPEETLLTKRRRAELYYLLLGIVDKNSLGDKVEANKRGELQLDAQALFRRIASLLQNGAKESDSMAVQARWEACTYHGVNGESHSQSQPGV